MADPENVPALNTAMTALRQRVRDLENEIAAVHPPLDPASLADEAVARAKQLLQKLLGASQQSLKHAPVERIDLKFTEGIWGKRRVRMVAGGSITLRQRGKRKCLPEAHWGAEHSKESSSLNL